MIVAVLYIGRLHSFIPKKDNATNGVIDNKFTTKYLSDVTRLNFFLLILVSRVKGIIK